MNTKNKKQNIETKIQNLIAQNPRNPLLYEINGTGFESFNAFVINNKSTVSTQTELNLVTNDFLAT